MGTGRLGEWRFSSHLLQFPPLLLLLLRLLLLRPQSPPPSPGAGAGAPLRPAVHSPPASLRTVTAPSRKRRRLSVPSTARSSRRRSRDASASSSSPSFLASAYQLASLPRGVAGGSADRPTAARRQRRGWRCVCVCSGEKRLRLPCFRRGACYPAEAGRSGKTLRSGARKARGNQTVARHPTPSAVLGRRKEIQPILTWK